MQNLTFIPMPTRTWASTGGENGHLAPPGNWA